MRYHLRTLLILLAVGPPLGAAGYWAWDAIRPKPSPWYTTDGNIQYFPPGPYFKLSREAARQKVEWARQQSEHPTP